MRLEVDELTSWQKRNKRWLADHPLAVSLTCAVLFGGLFGLLGSSGDSSSGLGIGAALGVLAGASFGWAFSVENRESVGRGTRVAAYSLCALGVVAFIVVKTM